MNHPAHLPLLYIQPVNTPKKVKFWTPKTNSRKLKALPRTAVPKHTTLKQPSRSCAN